MRWCIVTGTRRHVQCNESLHYSQGPPELVHLFAEESLAVVFTDVILCAAATIYQFHLRDWNQTRSTRLPVARGPGARHRDVPVLTSLLCARHWDDQRCVRVLVRHSREQLAFLTVPFSESEFRDVKRVRAHSVFVITSTWMNINHVQT